MNFKKLFYTIAAALSLSLLSSVTAFAQTGTVTCDVLKVRSSTGTSTPVITKVNFGDTLELLAYDGAWYKVKLPSGITGYVSADYISPDTALYGTVTASSLVIRSSTGTSSSPITSLPNGSLVELLAYDGAWYKVRLHGGIDGYASADYISPVTDAYAPSSPLPSYESEAKEAEDEYVCYAYVSSDIARMHVTTGDLSTVLSPLTKYEKLTVLAYDGAWYKVARENGIEGFVSSAHIVLSEDEISSYPNYTSIAGYIDATGLNIRAESNASSEVLSTLSMGTQVSLTGFDGEWYTVKLPDGRLGYASGEYVSLNPVQALASKSPVTSPKDAVAPTAPTDFTYSLGKQIVATANNYIGVPYVWAAEGPDSFDCSGFTMYVMNLNGISLPHQSGMQYTYGFSVEQNELIAGDLVFFNSNNTEGVAHVGIYIGDGKFIHASSGRAYSVTISSLSEDYYTAHYLGARRVI